MGKLRWYKRDADAALAGMMELSLEERGAYNTVLDLIYARDGQVMDDERFISGWLRCDVRVWKRIRTRLLELGKLYEKDGFLHNSRADVEVSRGLEKLASASDAGRASAAKRAIDKSENNDLASTDVEQTSQPLRIRTTEESKKEGSLRDLDRSDDWPSNFREEFWRLYPRKVGKITAIAKLERVRKSGVPFSKLARAIENLSTSTELQFTPNPLTWLNRGSWDDEPVPGGQNVRSFPSAKPTLEERCEQFAQRAELFEDAAGFARPALPIRSG